jgi:(E)-4-hydroxy-3-methylbut-2-enyl-diphosphate synthase
VPIVADIHFHYKRAIEAAQARRRVPAHQSRQYRLGSARARSGAGGQGPWLLDAHRRQCRLARKGIAGALRRAVPRSDGRKRAQPRRILEDNDFTEFKISVKASDVFLAVAAYQALAEACDYPLHLGITEAGGLRPARSNRSIGMGMLLWAGIGDTIRVSLSADPVEEIRAGFDMLKSLGLRHRGVNIVSCPSCARQGFNVIDTVRVLEERLKHIATPMTLSIIGCVVNGPGEARETDMGFTGGGAGAGAGMIYLNGKPAYKLDNGKLVDHVVELCEKKAAEIEASRDDKAALEPAL